MSDEHPVANAIRNAFGTDEYGNNISEAISNAFLRHDENLEVETTIVDVIESLANNARMIAHAITPTDASPGPCPSGEGQVGSLTEAVMGLTKAMMQIASSIQSVADAIESHS